MMLKDEDKPIYPGAPGICMDCCDMDGTILCEPAFCQCSCHVSSGGHRGEL